MGEAIPMDLLITKPEHSLVFQSRDASFHPGCLDKRNIRVNGDGFGVAWYNPKKIEDGACVVKFPTPAWSSPNLLNIAKFVESGLVFAHVRAASDGAALVGNVNHENTHPFKYKRYTFMHNGGIPGFDTMKRQLLSLVGDEAYEAIEGTTDSEVCFAYFLDELPSTAAQLSAAEIAQVLRRTIARLVTAVASSTGTAGAVDAPPMSLNFCVTDGRHIVCARYRNHARQDPPSLFVLSGAGFACDKEGCLRLTAEEPHTSVVISSEPLCRSTKSWKLVPRNSMVIVEGTAPTTTTAMNGNGEVADDTPVRLGLVSSIAFESLRCHPSDAPAVESEEQASTPETLPLAKLSPIDSRADGGTLSDYSGDSEDDGGVDCGDDVEVSRRIRESFFSSHGSPNSAHPFHLRQESALHVGSDGVFSCESGGLMTSLDDDASMSSTQLMKPRSAMETAKLLALAKHEAMTVKATSPAVAEPAAVIPSVSCGPKGLCGGTCCRE